MNFISRTLLPLWLSSWVFNSALGAVYEATLENALNLPSSDDFQTLENVNAAEALKDVDVPDLIKALESKPTCKATFQRLERTKYIGEALDRQICNNLKQALSMNQLDKISKSNAALYHLFHHENKNTRAEAVNALWTFGKQYHYWLRYQIPATFFIMSFSKKSDKEVAKLFLVYQRVVADDETTTEQERSFMWKRNQSFEPALEGASEATDLALKSFLFINDLRYSDFTLHQITEYLEDGHMGQLRENKTQKRFMNLAMEAAINSKFPKRPCELFQFFHESMKLDKKTIRCCFSPRQLAVAAPYLVPKASLEGFRLRHEQMPEYRPKWYKFSLVDAFLLFDELGMGDIVYQYFQQKGAGLKAGEQPLVDNFKLVLARTRPESQLRPLFEALSPSLYASMNLPAIDWQGDGSAAEYEYEYVDEEEDGYVDEDEEDM